MQRTSPTPGEKDYRNPDQSDEVRVNMEIFAAAAAYACPAASFCSTAQRTSGSLKQ